MISVLVGLGLIGAGIYSMHKDQVERNELQQLLNQYAVDYIDILQNEKTLDRLGKKDD